MTRKRYFLLGGILTAVTLAALLILGNRPVVRAAEGDQVEYTFGRPVEKGEQTYDWYRKTHADEAAKRYGVDPNAVGDGMDTWHWWAGVDNPVWWRKASVLTAGKEYSALNVRLDFFRLLQTISRADRWAQMGLINDPDTVPADKPDQYGLTIDRSKGRRPNLGSGGLRLPQRRHGLSAFHQQEIRREEVVRTKIPG